MNQEYNPQQHVQQARSIHTQLDSYRSWARKQAADYRAKAEVAEEVDYEEIESIPGSPDELRQIARILETVAKRIEQGDFNQLRKVAQYDDSND